MRNISQRKWGLYAAAIALIGIAAWWTAEASIGYATPLCCCVEDPGTGGGLGLVLWAKQLGIPMRPLREPLWEAVRHLDSPVGNCVITAGNGGWSPGRDELTPEQWAAIRNWVKQGNALVVVTTDPGNLPIALVKDLMPKAPSPVKANSRNGPDDVEFFNHRVEARPVVTTVELPGGGSMSVRASGPRWKATPTAWEHAGDNEGTVWHRGPLGAGAIYFILDDFAWTNAGFDNGANAGAFAALLKRELKGDVSGGVLGIDEYRHGHGRVESFATFLFDQPGSTSFWWMAVVLGGLYVLGRNVRFGPAEPFRVVERRSSREYVEAVAYLNERARAAPLAVESVVRRFRFVSARRGRMAADAEDAVKQAEAFASTTTRPAVPAEACELARRLVNLRKQHYGS